MSRQNGLLCIFKASHFFHSIVCDGGYCLCDLKVYSVSLCEYADDVAEFLVFLKCDLGCYACLISC